MASRLDRLYRGKATKMGNEKIGKIENGK